MADPRPELWVLGNVAIDDVVSVGSVTREMCGGNATYAAIGARIWSERVGLAARIGPDYPSACIDRLRAAGIDVRLSAVSEASMHHWALYEGTDVRRFVMWNSSGTHQGQSLLPSEVPAEACAASMCHLAPMPLAIQSSLVEHLALSGPLVSLDPHDEYVDGQLDEVLALLARVTVFLPSRHEARLLLGRDDPEAAAREFASSGPRVAVIKLGSEGSVICEAGKARVHHVPAVAVTVVDPTGAGDAYCGAFGVVYARTGDALEAALHATVAASFVVERSGATCVLPVDRAEADRRLQLLRSDQYSK